MNHSPPVVSVIVPAYNAAATLSATLESAQNQTLREIEILVVDDGSSDETVALVETFAAKDSRIRLLKQTNAGVGAARNTAIRAAEGEFIAPLDADDLWLPEKLARQVERMQQGGGGMGMVYCGSQTIGRHGEVLTINPLFNLEGHLRKTLILKNFIGGASVPVFRKTVLAKTGFYMERPDQDGAMGCEDWDLSLRVAEVATVGAIEAHLVQYRQMDDCMSLNADGMIRSYSAMIRRARIRNPDLPPALFQWSAGQFYNYLASKQHRWGDHAGYLRCLWHGGRQDPALLLNDRIHKMALKSLWHLLKSTVSRSPVKPSPRTSGKPARPQPVSASPRSRPRGGQWFHRINEHRWHQVRSDPSP